MSIEVAERLKNELTDKYVVVADGVPELRRFAGLTGTVRTVNMNGQALVQFDNPIDISWYDIDPSYLTVVDKPLEKKKPAAAAPKDKPKAAAKTGAKPAAGKSPLELAREQGAAKAGAAAAPKAKSGLSPLELARQQGAAKKEGAAKPAEAAAKPESAGKKLSPLELARQQDAAKKAEAAEESAETAATEEAAPEAAESKADEPKKEVPTTGPDGKKLSPLELARQQGAFKG